MLVPVWTFEGEPLTIDIAYLTETACGGRAKIIRGNMVNQSGSRDVAIKVFKTMLDKTEQMLLYRKLEIARQVSGQHPFIAPFVGTAHIGPETSIVSLYMKNGNLLDYLKANKGADRKKLIIQVAEAVVFLHSNQRLVHGDLKCANVLISDFGNALLADFGLSTFIESSAKTATEARIKCTLRFAAPELLSDTAGIPPHRRSKTGMLVLEALTEQSPWFGLHDLAVIKLVDSGAIPWRPTDGSFVSVSPAWWNICKACWTHDPSTRPTMRVVLDDLRHLPSRIIVETHDGPHGDFISTFTYMPCGQRIAVGRFAKRESDRRTAIAIYDIASSQIVAGPMIRAGHPFRCLGVSRDGQKIAALSSFGVTWWDTASGALFYKEIPLTGVAWSCRALSPDAKYATSQTCDGRAISFWDTSTGQLIGKTLGGMQIRSK